MSKLKKIEKEFLLTDNSVNCYGFRLLTEGYLMSEFQKNPIGYGMHKRTEGVLVRWEDLRTDGDKVYGKPVINLSHPDGQRTLDEVENGFLNAASVGHLVILEYTDDDKLMLPGQTSYTVTKWYNRECSLVDVPGNFNALKQLVDSNDQPINLSDFTNLKFLSMKEIKFSALQLIALSLTTEATEPMVEKAFNDLVAKACRVDALELNLKNLKANANKEKVIVLIANAGTKLPKALAEKLAADYSENPDGLKSLIDALPGSEGKVTEILSAALAAKKITKELHDKLAVDYSDKPTELKNLVDAMPSYTSVVDGMGGKGAEPRYAKLMAKSYDELMESGESELLAKEAPALWKIKREEEFGSAN